MHPRVPFVVWYMTLDDFTRDAVERCHQIAVTGTPDTHSRSLYERALKRWYLHRIECSFSTEEVAFVKEFVGRMMAESDVQFVWLVEHDALLHAFMQLHATAMRELQHHVAKDEYRELYRAYAMAVECLLTFYRWSTEFIVWEDARRRVPRREFFLDVGLADMCVSPPHCVPNASDRRMCLD